MEQDKIVRSTYKGKEITLQLINKNMVGVNHFVLSKDLNTYMHMIIDTDIGTDAYPLVFLSKEEAENFIKELDEEWILLPKTYMTCYVKGYLILDNDSNLGEAKQNIKEEI